MSVWDWRIEDTTTHKRQVLVRWYPTSVLPVMVGVVSRRRGAESHEWESHLYVNGRRYLLKRGGCGVCRKRLQTWAKAIDVACETL